MQQRRGGKDDGDHLQVAAGIKPKNRRRGDCFSPRLLHRLPGVIVMLEQLMMFMIRDALFMLGVLSRGNAFPKPLEREEEEKLLRQMTEGNAKAREKLIEHNLRLAAHIARKYTVPGYDQDDLISIGTVGLIKGVNTFRPGGGTQLSTYCARCIENPMLSPV